MGLFHSSCISNQEESKGVTIMCFILWNWNTLNVLMSILWQCQIIAKSSASLRTLKNCWDALKCETPEAAKVTGKHPRSWGGFVLREVLPSIKESQPSEAYFELLPAQGSCHAGLELSWGKTRRVVRILTDVECCLHAITPFWNSSWCSFSTQSANIWSVVNCQAWTLPIKKLFWARREAA